MEQTAQYMQYLVKATFATASAGSIKHQTNPLEDIEETLGLIFKVPHDIILVNVKRPFD